MKEVKEGDEYLERFQSVTSFLKNDNWDLIDGTSYRRTVVSMYFALTSLSTTGFGDYFPITSYERLVCSFLLLVGVSLFSYILSEFRYMIGHFERLKSGLEEVE